MQSLRRILAVTSSAVALTACQEVPTEVAMEDVRFASERTVEEALYDLTDSHFAFSCDENGNALELGEGELIRIEGQIFERAMLVRDATGEFHFSLHTMPVNLSGVGVDSGEHFRIVERDKVVASQHGEGNSGSYNSTLKMRGETGRTFWMRFSGSYRIGNDGELVRERNSETIVCRA